MARPPAPPSVTRWVAPLCLAIAALAVIALVLAPAHAHRPPPSSFGVAAVSGPREHVAGTTH